MPYADVPAFMERLRATEGTTARALEFCILTAARTGEVLGETFSLLQYLFNSPDDKPTQLKHAPLEGKQYRRGRSAVHHEQVAERG